MNINRNHNIKLLIVDDSSHIRYPYKQILNQINGIGWTILEAKTGDQGLDLCRTEKPDCILLDYILPDTDGLEFLLQLKKISLTTPVIMLTGQGDETAAVLAMKEGASDCLVKDTLTAVSLKKAILNCLEENDSMEVASKDLKIKPGNKSSRPKWNKKKKVELISEIQTLKEKLESSSSIDPLTELPNRGNMLDKLHYEKCRFERNKKPFSLIMADIDNFSVIQESYESKTFNAILAQVGKFLDLNSRKQDVVSHWGKERFLLLLPETGLEGAAVLIEKLCKKVEMGEFSHPGQAIPITMSFRAGAYDDETMAIEDCILEADGCLL